MDDLTKPTDGKDGRPYTQFRKLYRCVGCGQFGVYRALGTCAWCRTDAVAQRGKDG